jgi:HAD superfamily hydrolase (TIGR01490 family)
MGLVFFDFDGTLTRRDSILPLGLFLAARTRARAAKTAQLLWLLTLLKGRVISNHRFKEAFCALLLKGETEQVMERCAADFADARVVPVLNDAIVDALRRHQQQRDEVYLVSSNFSFALRPLEARWHLHGIFATEAEVVSGRFTGRIAGRTCDGPEKLTRVLAAFGEERVRAATAYGDSRGDGPLLDYVKQAVWV